MGQAVPQFPRLCKGGCWIVGGGGSGPRPQVPPVPPLPPAEGPIGCGAPGRGGARRAERSLRPGAQEPDRVPRSCHLRLRAPTRPCATSGSGCCARWRCLVSGSRKPSRARRGAGWFFPQEATRAPNPWPARTRHPAPLRAGSWEPGVGCTVVSGWIHLGRGGRGGRGGRREPSKVNCEREVPPLSLLVGSGPGQAGRLHLLREAPWVPGIRLWGCPPPLFGQGGKGGQRSWGLEGKGVGLRGPVSCLGEDPGLLTLDPAPASGVTWAGVCEGASGWRPGCFSASFLGRWGRLLPPLLPLQVRMPSWRHVHYCF